MAQSLDSWCLLVLLGSFTDSLDLGTVLRLSGQVSRVPAVQLLDLP